VLTALAKAAPGTINYSSTGVGTSGHMTMELYKTLAGVDLNHVQYKNFGQATTELLMEIAGPLALPYVKDDPDDMGHNEGPVGADWALPTAPQYFNNRKVSIYGGTNEIQHNIIAKAVLGF
jgi:hypothetical protein